MTRPMRSGSQSFRRDAADLVEPLEPEMLFVRADLEDGIGGGVADRLAGADVLLAELLDHVGAGGVAVAENAGELRLARSARRSALCGKAGIGVRENSPRRTAPAGRRAPNGRTACPCPSRLRWHRPRSPAAFRCARCPAGCVPVEASAARQMPRLFITGILSGPERRPGRSAAPGGAGGGDVAERVGALVAEFFRVRGAADADGIHDEKNRARHSALLRADPLVNEAAARRRLAERVGARGRSRPRLRRSSRRARGRCASGRVAADLVADAGELGQPDGMVDRVLGARAPAAERDDREAERARIDRGDGALPVRQ